MELNVVLDLLMDEVVACGVLGQSVGALDHVSIGIFFAYYVQSNAKANPKPKT